MSPVDESGVRRRPDLVDLEESLQNRRLYYFWRSRGKSVQEAAALTLGELRLFRSRRRLAEVPDVRRASNA